MPQLEVAIAYRPDIALYPPGAVYGPRTMHEYEFIWIMEGSMEYFSEYKGEKTQVSIPAGTVILCRPDTTELHVWDKHKGTRHGYFHFTLLECPPPWPAPAEWPFMRSMQEGDLLDTLARHLVGRSTTGSSAQQNLLATSFLAAFLTGETQSAVLPPLRFPETVERAIEYIYSRLDADSNAPLDLDSIAHAACVSPEHLCRVFRAATGHSPLETVRLARLDRAVALLSRSNFSVSQVAHLTGFASPFHFSRTFKKVYGYTPREMRQAALRGEDFPPLRVVKNLHFSARRLSGDPPAFESESSGSESN